MPPDLALLKTLIGSNYPCLELIFMVPKVFEALKFYCMMFLFSLVDKEQFFKKCLLLDVSVCILFNHFNIFSALNVIY